MAESTKSTLLSLIAVARTHGVELTIEALQSTYVIDDQNLPSSILVSIAQDAGLEARCVKAQWSDLKRLGNILPAILMLKDGGAAVLSGFGQIEGSGFAAAVEDPSSASEAVLVDEMQLAEIWSGEIVLVKRKHNFADDDQPFGMRWIFNHVLQERRLFREIAIAATVSTVFALMPPFLVRIIVDRVLANQSVSTLWILSGGFALIVSFEMVLQFLKRRFSEVTATRIDGRLNLYLMKKVLSLPMEYFEKNPTGLIMSKLSKVWQVRQFLTGQLFSTFLDTITLFVLVPVLFVMQWQLAFLIMALALIIFVIVVYFVPAATRSFEKVVRAEQIKSTYLTETVYGMRTIKSLALEGRRKRDWDVHVARSVSARYDYGELMNQPATLSLPFERSFYGGSFLIGAAFALSAPDVVEPGQLMAFAMLAGRTAQPLIQLAKMLHEWGEIRGAVSQAASVLNHPSEESRAGTGLRMPVYGHILFQNLDFRYAPASPLALSGVNIEIRPGTIFGIMGRSGSGKTTITRLLQGLNPKYDGIIKIDGMDLREMDLRHLRTSIGVVPQENFLFSGTVRENIGIAKPNATFAEIARAAQLAGAEEFIERMPAGYDTYLSEGGANLSGGQRQRLAIARALVLDPPVLILDEATSALDAESEAIINANLLRIAQGRTIIAVSHRLSMLVPADAILVMEKGKVYDIGTHEELLHRCDIYKHMWYTQNRHSQPSPSNAPRPIALSSHG